MKHSEQMELSSHDNETQRLVAGYAKTGRTWMRYMLAHALSVEHNLGINIDLTNVYELVPNDAAGLVPGQPTFQYGSRVPKIEMTHRAYTSEYSGSHTVFLTRDPRDVTVSHWLHHKNQLGKFDGDLNDFIRSPLGISSFVAHLETWAPNLEAEQILTYEAMRQNPDAALKRTNELLEIGLSDKSIRHAVDAGEINQMRKVEVEHGIAGHNYDRENPEALRVRRGEVGGYVDYMQPLGQTYVQDALQELSGTAAAIISMTGYYDPDLTQRL